MDYVDVDEIRYYIDTQANIARVGNGEPQNPCPTNINIHSTVSYNNNIYPVTTISANAFKDCPITTFNDIPEGITNIEEMAFYFCYFQKQIVTLPDSLIHIGPTCFSHSTITEVRIGSKLQTYGAKCFARTDVKKFIVNPMNPYFTTDEQYCLYSKDMSTLYQATGYVDNLIIPQSVTTLIHQCIDGISIKSVTIPRYINFDRNIPHAYIRACPRLETVHIICNLYSYTAISYDQLIMESPKIKKIFYVGSTDPSPNFIDELNSSAKIFVYEQNLKSINGYATTFIPTYVWPVHTCKVDTVSPYKLTFLSLQIMISRI